MLDVITYWAAAMALATLALPITFALFGRLPDGGAGFAFIIGVLFTSFGYFLLRVVGILDAGRGGVVVAVLLLAVASAVVAGRSPRFWTSLHRRTPELLLVAALFGGLFVGYASFRSYNAEIDHTEQPMDFLFLNAAIASPGYPPQDPWLAGEPVSYYYFGYVEAAVLTQLADVPPSVGYNLSLAFVFAASGTAIASLAAALVRWATRTRSAGWLIGASAAGIALLLFVGSLYAPFEWAASHGHTSEPLYDAMGLEWLLPCESGSTEDCYTSETSRWYPDRFWFWWDGSRIIPGTITEFPFFSFLLGDLHPHVMAIPGVLLAIGLAAVTWRGRGPLAFANHRRAPWFGVAAAVIIAALAFTNTWDVITFTAAFVVAVVARNLRYLPVRQVAVDSALFVLPIALLALVLLLPWLVDFTSQASGFYPYVGEGTRPAHAFLQFGPLVILGLLAALPAVRGGWMQFGRTAAFTVWVPLVPLLAWVALAAINGDLGTGVEERGAGGWVTLTVYALAAWTAATAFVVLARARRHAALAAGAAALGLLLLLGAELFFIRDLFYGSMPRLNTVFKLTYQAWILLALAGAAGSVLVLHTLRMRTIALVGAATPLGILVAAGLVYALLALPNRTDGFGSETTLDGLEYLQRTQPGEYQLAAWIRDNVDPADTVIEATGRAWVQAPDGSLVQDGGSIDYQSEISRVSARTGVPVPVGWYFHEIQWRGDSAATRERLAHRQDLVDGVYTTQDPQVVLELMRQLDARYVVVGHAERSRYVVDAMPDFAGFLDTAFALNDVAVYALPVYEVRNAP